MNNLGGVLYQQGDFRGATNLFENLLNVRKAAGDKLGVAVAKSNLADALRVQGETDRAAGLYEQALKTLKEIGDRSTAAAVAISLAKTMIVKNDFAAARRILREALTTNEEVGAKGDAALNHVMLARIAFLERHPEEFDASLDTAIDELKKENRGADEIEARALQAEVLLARGRTGEAQQALEKAKSIQAADWLARFHLDTAFARLESAKGNDTKAKRTLTDALTQAQETRCVVCQLEVRAALSQIQGEHNLPASRPR
jgi:tetratricopeptide (TPR) repeat protein